MEAHWITADLAQDRMDPHFYQDEYIRAHKRVLGIPNTTLELVRKKSRPICYGVLKPVFFEKGIALVRNQDFSNPGVDNSKLAYISNEKHLEFKRSCLDAGDLLVTIGGYVGTAAIVPPHLAGSNINQHIARVSVDESKYDSHFAWAFIRSETGTLLLNRYISGVAQPGVNLTDLKEILFPDPLRTIQRSIGNKVRKAERLRESADSAVTRLNSWLATAARQDLAHQDVAKYLSHVPASTVQDARWIKSLAFGDRLDPWPTHVAPSTVRNHLLTHGSTVPFSTLLTAVYNGKGSPPAGVPGCHHVSILDVDNDGHVNWAAAEKGRYGSDGIIIKPGDILFPTLNPNETRIAVVPADKTSDNAASSEFVCLRPNKAYEAYPFLIAAILRSPWVRVQVAFLTRSSSLSRRRIDDGDLQYLHIPWIDDGALADLNQSLSLAVDARHEAVELIEAAKADVEALIDGTLDQAKLLADGAAIDAWLSAHPRPEAT